MVASEQNNMGACLIQDIARFHVGKPVVLGLAGNFPEITRAEGVTGPRQTPAK
jgi:hypothetical protein